MCCWSTRWYWDRGAGCSPTAAHLPRSGWSTPSRRPPACWSPLTGPLNRQREGAPRTAAGKSRNPPPRALLARPCSLALGTVVFYAGADEIPKGGFVERIALVDVDCPRLVAFEHGIEELVRVREARARVQGQSDPFFQDAHRANDSVVL